MKYLPILRFSTYAMIVAIVVMLLRQPHVIPVELTAPKWITSVQKEMIKGRILSSLTTASKVTAQIIWSDGETYSPTDPVIITKSDIIEISEHARSKVIEMLNLDQEYEDFGQPCLCYFQPQLRLLWTSADTANSYCILVSGVSHGEIRSYTNGKETGTVKKGLFIPYYLEILNESFPHHETTLMLHEFHKERLKEKTKQQKGI